MKIILILARGVHIKLKVDDEKSRHEMLGNESNLTKQGSGPKLYKEIQHNH